MIEAPFGIFRLIDSVSISSILFNLIVALAVAGFVFRLTPHILATAIYTNAVFYIDIIRKKRRIAGGRRGYYRRILFVNNSMRSFYKEYIFLISISFSLLAFSYYYIEFSKVITVYVLSFILLAFTSLSVARVNFETDNKIYKLGAFLRSSAGVSYGIAALTAFSFLMGMLRFVSISNGDTVSLEHNGIRVEAIFFIDSGAGPIFIDSDNKNFFVLMRAGGAVMRLPSEP